MLALTKSVYELNIAEKGRHPAPSGRILPALHSSTVCFAVSPNSWSWG